MKKNNKIIEIELSDDVLGYVLTYSADRNISVSSAIEELLLLAYRVNNFIYSAVEDYMTYNE